MDEKKLHEGTNLWRDDQWFWQNHLIPKFYQNLKLFQDVKYQIFQRTAKTLVNSGPFFGF